MRSGFALPQVGEAAGPEAVAQVAKRAEALGVDSLWVLDRALYPVAPKAPYPVGDGTLPLQYRTTLDPFATLSFVAGQTERVKLGTSILNLPWYNPVLLARQLSALDVLSKGRLVVGFGIGWSPDEYEAMGSPWSERGRRADELLDVLKAIWTSDPVEFHGEYYTIPASTIGPKPAQKPHPPIYMAAYVPAALNRVARHATGWFPVGIPLGAVGEMMESIRAMATTAGRDGDAIELIMRANVEFSESPLGDDRADFTGTLEQVAADVATTREIGAAELVIDVQFSPDTHTGDDYITRLEQLHPLVVG